MPEQNGTRCVYSLTNHTKSQGLKVFSGKEAFSAKTRPAGLVSGFGRRRKTKVCSTTFFKDKIAVNLLSLALYFPPMKMKMQAHNFFHSTDN